MDINTLFALTIPWMGELQFRGQFPNWVPVLLGLAAIAAIGVLYAKEIGRLSATRRLILAGVRIAILVAVAFLMLRPILVQESTGDRRRPVAVLIDVSASMDANDPRPAIEDQWRAALAYGFIEPDKPFPKEPFTSIVPKETMPERPSRFDVARKALLNSKLDLLNRLSSAGPLEIYTFGSTRTGRNAFSTDWLKDLAADQPRTALVTAAYELLNRDDNDLPTAIVIITDGRENASDRTVAELTAKCREKQVPLHIYGVGSSSFGQLRLRDASVPESVFLDDLVAIPVRYAIKGIPAGRVNIVVDFGLRFKFTDQVIDQLRIQKVPEAVLGKLAAVKNNELRREDLERMLAGGFLPGEKEKYFKLILEQARFAGREVAAKLGMPVMEGDDLREVLTYTPTKEDAAAKHQDITVTVTVIPDAPAGVAVETHTDTATKPTQVITKKLKVLVVDGLPRVDFKFLQRALLRDRRVDARFFLTEGDRDAMKSGYPWLVEFTRQLSGTVALEPIEFRKLINDFDLLILGDVPPRFFSPVQQKIIKEFVAEGGGMIHIAGRWNAPRGWLEADEEVPSIADVLPVELLPVKFALQPPEGRYYQPFVPVVAPSAVRNPLIILEDDPEENADIWGKLTRMNPDDPVQPGPKRANRKPQLQPMEWYYPVQRLKPGAEVFLFHPTARTPEPDSRPMPLLAGHYFGKGYVLFAAFDDTWRWRYNEADRYFGRFWSQCVYQAGVPRMLGTKLTQLSLDTAEPIQGKSGQVYARILDESFNPITIDELTATLERIDANANDTDKYITVKLHKMEGHDGEYVAPLPFNRAGRYKLSVDPKNNSPASLEYRVSLPPDHELAPGGMAEAEMRKLATDSGTDDYPGRFYQEEDLHVLPAKVKTQLAPFIYREESVLWNGWALGLLIALLSLEWFLRKFSGLS